MRKIIFIVAVFLCSTIAFSQVKKNAISFNILGTTPAVGLTYERILSQHMSLEVGIGTNSVGLGVKIMPFKIRESSMMFTTGLTTTYIDYNDNYILGDKRILFYVPIGMSYYGVKGFNFGIDVGPVYRNPIGDSNDYSGATIHAGIKIGQRF